MGGCLYTGLSLKEILFTAEHWVVKDLLLLAVKLMAFQLYYPLISQTVYSYLLSERLKTAKPNP